MRILIAEAMALVNGGSPSSTSVLDKLRKLPGVKRVLQVVL
jgi:hypothetical protein